MKAKYRDLAFKTGEEYQKWLNDTTDKIITFKDKGQDLTKIWIDERGEILNSIYQTEIWNGGIVDKNRLAINKPVFLLSNDRTQWCRSDFIIESIEENKK